MFDKNNLSGFVSQLTNVDDNKTADYTNENTHVKMSRYCAYYMKNSYTANATIRYAFYVCKDDDNEEPIQSVREELIDRGYTGVPTRQPAIPASALASEVPPRVEFGLNHFHDPKFSGAALKKNWRQVGKVKTVTLGPGDSTKMVWSDKFTYAQEYIDQENSFAHLKGYSVVLMLNVQGDLAHDNSPPKAVVGYASCGFDCEKQVQCTITYSNPKGLHEVDSSDNLTNENFTVPVHVDNQASAVEQSLN